MLEVAFRRVVDDLEMLSGTIRIDLLDHEICYAGVQLQSGGSRNWARTDMRLDPHAVGFRHGCNLLCLHDAASVTNVGLENIRRVAFDYWTETVASIDPLS